MNMVKRLLNLPAEPRADSADALACAICHAHGGMGLAGLTTIGRRRKAGRML
jgi:crossover junction endodeoxyribonuclease RuvC